MRNGLVVGVFDLFHVGHVRLLARARALVDTLFVIVNGDELTASYKRRPIVDEKSRLEVVMACRYVDYAEISNSYDIKPAVEQHSITHIIHGDDWNRTSYLDQIRLSEQDLLRRQVQLLFLPYTGLVSTSGIIAQCTSARITMPPDVPAPYRDRMENGGPARP